MALSVSVRVRGTRALRQGIEALTPGRNRQYRRRVLKGWALIVQRNVKQKQILRRGGKLVPPHPTKLTYRTGHLSRSIDWKQNDAYTAEVGTPVVYGRPHELGTPPMPRRAFLQPAADETQTEARAFILAEWKRTVNKYVNTTGGTQS